MSSARPVPIGVDDFRAVRERELDYVDKSLFIRDIIDRRGTQVFLFPRPRRFGKTLNLSMLHCWFEKRDEDFSPLFQDLAIWGAGPLYRDHFQRHPVIYFNFKGTKEPTFDLTFAAIAKKIEVLFGDHRSLLESDRLGERARRDFQTVLEGKADRTLLSRALLDLSAYLHAHHGERRQH